MPWPLFPLLTIPFFLLLPPSERKNPPVFTKKPSENIEDTEGKLVKIEGRVSGSQPIAVAWYKDNTEIYSSDKYDISFKSNVAVLCIKSSQVSDSGRYSCQATNEAGKASCDFSVGIAGGFGLQHCFTHITLQTHWCLKDCKPLRVFPISA